MGNVNTRLLHMRLKLHQDFQSMRLAKRWQRNACLVKPAGALAGIAAAGLVVRPGESAECSAAKQALQVEHPVVVGLANLADQPDEASKRAFAMKNMQDGGDDFFAPFEDYLLSSLSVKFYFNKRFYDLDSWYYDSDNWKTYNDYDLRLEFSKKINPNLEITILGRHFFRKVSSSGSNEVVWIEDYKNHNRNEMWLKFIYNGFLTGMPPLTYNAMTKTTFHAPFTIQPKSVYFNYALNETQKNYIQSYIHEYNPNMEMMPVRIFETEETAKYYLSVNVYNCTSPIFFNNQNILHIASKKQELYI